MLGILLISGSFFLVIMMACFFLVVHIKRWTVQREEENQRRFEELSNKIDDTQRLFRTDVTELLKNFNRILPDKK